jgi:hypothetical protein
MFDLVIWPGRPLRVSSPLGERWRVAPDEGELTHTFQQLAPSPPHIVRHLSPRGEENPELPTLLIRPQPDVGRAR